MENSLHAVFPGSNPTACDVEAQAIISPIQQHITSLVALKTHSHKGRNHQYYPLQGLDKAGPKGIFEDVGCTLRPWAAKHQPQSATCPLSTMDVGTNFDPYSLGFAEPPISLHSSLTDLTAQGNSIKTNTVSSKIQCVLQKHGYGHWSHTARHRRYVFSNPHGLCSAYIPNQTVPKLF